MKKTILAGLILVSFLTACGGEFDIETEAKKCGSTLKMIHTTDHGHGGSW